MRLIIDGEDLQGVGFAEITKDTPLVGGADLVSSYSVDFSVPRTQTNDRLLGTSCFPDRIGNVGVDRIDCTFTCPLFSAAGYIEVNSVTDGEVDITLFIEPTRVSMLLRHVFGAQDTQLPLPMAPDSGQGLATIGLRKYSQSEDRSEDNYITQGAPYFSFLHLTNLIYSATGLTAREELPSVAFMPTSWYVSPYRRTQWLVAAPMTNMTYCEFRGEQNVTNNIGDSGRNSRTFEVTFDRDVTCPTIYLYGRKSSEDVRQSISFSIRKRRGVRELIIGTVTVPADAISKTLILYDITFRKGESLCIRFETQMEHVYQHRLYICLYSMVYQRFETDFGAKKIQFSDPSGELYSDEPDYANEGYRSGTYCFSGNCGDVTVAQLLRSLALALGRNCTLIGRTYSFTPFNDTSVPIECFDKEFSPVSSDIAQRNVIEWGGEEQVVMVGNSRLDDEKKHFDDNVLWIGGTDSGRAWLPNIDVSSLEHKDMQQPFMLIDRQVLTPWGDRFQRVDVSAMNRIERCVALSAKTTDMNICNARIINVSGKDYLLTSWDYEEEGGVVEFSAIQLGSIPTEESE